MGDMIWEMKCDPKMKKLRWYVAPIWRFDFGKGITKVIWRDCDDMWLLSEKPILWLVLASQMDPRAAQRPKSGKPFNWKSHLQIINQLYIKVDVICMSFGLQTSSRLLEKKLGRIVCTSDQKRWLLPSHGRDFVESWCMHTVPLDVCNQLMPQSTCWPRNVTKVSTESFLQWSLTGSVDVAWMKCRSSEMNCPPT